MENIQARFWKTCIYSLDPSAMDGSMGPSIVYAKVLDERYGSKILLQDAFLSIVAVVSIEVVLQEVLEVP